MHKTTEQQPAANQTCETRVSNLDKTCGVLSTRQSLFALSPDSPDSTAPATVHCTSSARHVGPRVAVRLPLGDLTRRFGCWVIPWLCLFVLTATAARGVQIATESILSDASDTAGAPQVNGSATTAKTSGGVQRVAVTIDAYDPITGSRTQERCMTTSDRITLDTLTVDMQLLRDVEAALCQPQ